MEFIRADGKEYPARVKRGSAAETLHVKLTVGTDCRNGKQIQHDYTGKTVAEIQEKIDASMRLSDEELQLFPEDISLERLRDVYLESKELRVTPGCIKRERDWFRIRILP